MRRREQLWFSEPLNGEKESEMGSLLGIMVLILLL